MSSPLFWPTKTFFYPIGNTPAVCLTQDLPPEQSADVLLLGCGDARNVLYTVYADLPSPSGPRKLDLTCCDYQPAILARNILLYVMIVENEPIDKMWNVYYHLFFDESSFAILVRHCKALLALSTTADKWHKSKYGPWLKVIDSNTLFELRRYWQLYMNFKHIGPKRKSALRSRFEKLAAPNRDVLNAAAARSAGPLALYATVELSKLFNHFWKSGTTFLDAKEVQLATHINPTFVYCLEGEKFEPHYGTFPLQSFHLASAFVPVASVSRAVAAPDTIVDTARDEFSAWCTRFRQVINDQNNTPITIRFYTGDALAFCSGLSHYSRTGNPWTPFYGTAWRSHRVHLDHASSIESPTSFDVIDSSNLTDHLGLMNILLVAEPLLKNGMDHGVVVYTETLLPLGEDAARSFPQRLCGDPQVMAVLIGLVPRPLVIGFHGTSVSQELLRYCISSLEEQHSEQYHERVCWVRPVDGDNARTAPALLRSLLSPRDLGALCFDIYDKLLEFEHSSFEDLSRTMSRSKDASERDADLEIKERIRYTRTSFAQLIRHIRDRMVLSEDIWRRGIIIFLDKIVNDSTRLVGMNLFQDLSLQLHIRGIYTTDVLRDNWTTLPLIECPIPPEVFPGWPQIPSVLCIALTVPRHAMGPLLSIFHERGSGTPVFLLHLDTGEGHSNAFSCLHAVPGKLDLSIDPPVVEESKGPLADAPSFVFSCWVPAWLLTYPRTTVGLMIQSTPQTTRQFLSKLGPMMMLYSARLTEKNSVRVLRGRPNMISELKVTPRTAPPSTPTSLRNSVSVEVTHTSSSISTFTGRLDICEDETKAALLQGAAIAAEQIGPCTVEVSIDTIKYPITYPFPIMGDQRKLRIARKSSYIEIIVPPSGSLSPGGYSLNLCPVVSRPSPAAWGLHAINLDHLPVMDVRNHKDFVWLNLHVGLQMSDRERRLRETDTGKSDTLMNVKDSIQCIFTAHAGLDQFNDRPRVFGLTEPDRGGIHTLLFIDKLRLDLAAFTVVADIAALPLDHGLMHRIEKGLEILTEQGFLQVVTRGSEAEAWRKLLPALVERCRTWTHKETCEYASAFGRPVIPISSVLGDPCICSCGRGIGLESFRDLNTFPSWKYLRSFATRAALGPLFAVPYIEPVGDIVNKAAQKAQDETSTCVPASSSDEECAACGGPGKPKLLVCSRCKDAKYCSADCQRKDWKTHKKVCQT